MLTVNQLADGRANGGAEHTEQGEGKGAIRLDRAPSPMGDEAEQGTRRDGQGAGTDRHVRIAHADHIDEERDGQH